MNKLWAILLCVLLIRVVHHYATGTSISDGTLVRVKGQVSSEPYIYSDSQSVHLGEYRMYLPRYPEIGYGDRLSVEGRVDGDRLMNPTLIELNKSGNLLISFRKNMLSVYQAVLPQDHAALVAGMVIGSKQLISQDFREKLKITGTAHVVVASGMNVALIAGFLINLLAGFMVRRKAIIFALIGIWIYAFLAGFDAPIIRAAIMGSLTFSAQKIGRLNYAWRTLFITVAAMLIVKPQWIEDLGFLLSVAATTSLMLFERRIRNRLRIVPVFFRENLSTTLSAQILVAPVLFIYFGDINLIAPFTNALVLWTVPLITITGMIAGIIGLLAMPLARVTLLVIYPLSYWFIEIINAFS